MIDGQNFFDELVRNNLIAYDTIQKLQQIKEIVTKLIVCWTIITSNTIIR